MLPRAVSAAARKATKRIIAVMAMTISRGRDAGAVPAQGRRSWRRDASSLRPHRFPPYRHIGPRKSQRPPLLPSHPFPMARGRNGHLETLLLVGSRPRRRYRYAFPGGSVGTQTLSFPMAAAASISPEGKSQDSASVKTAWKPSKPLSRRYLFTPALARTAQRPQRQPLAAPPNDERRQREREQQRPLMGLRESVGL